MAKTKPKIATIEEATCEDCIYSQDESCLSVDGLGFEEGAFCNCGGWLARDFYAEGEVCVVNLIEAYNQFANER